MAFFYTLIALLLENVLVSASSLTLHLTPQTLSLTIGEDKEVQFYVEGELKNDVDITLKRTPYFDATPHQLLLTSNRSADVIITGRKITSYAVLEVEKCSYVNSSECPFTAVDLTTKKYNLFMRTTIQSECKRFDVINVIFSNLEFVFTSVKVVHSTALSIAVIVVGWIYFIAWSISFYPQIWLNFRRKSVVGLNFDFLLLNIIGFACYTFYNVLMYFDSHIQEIYEKSHPHSLIPVLMNDVVFAAHALFACLLTAVQCFFYKRGNQRVSYTCGGIAALFILFAIVAFIITLCNVLNALQFIMCLSYIKMAVTLCKYFPQAFMNYRRKSTVGWSIGNVLLDFLGGFMDIIQMVLQGANTDDWSIFYGNPVKFGLGMVSMVFDVLFMIQHYCLYRNHEEGPPLRSSCEDGNDEQTLGNATPLSVTGSDDVDVTPTVVRVGNTVTA